MTARRWIVPLAATAILLTVGLAGAQTAAPPTPNLPPLFSMEITPRRVVYLGSAPGASSSVVISAVGATDPEGQGLEYGMDANGDGVFTDWFFREDYGENVTMAGPFLASLRVRDAGQAVATQSVQMEARQFTTSYVDVGEVLCPSFAAVAGRPAIAYLRHDSLQFSLHFAINERADGSGPWGLSPVDDREGIACPIHLAVAGGRPSIAYTVSDNAEVAIARNTAADGGGAWTFAGESSKDTTFYYPTVSSIAGIPVLTYYNPDLGEVQLNLNDKPDGSGFYLPKTAQIVGHKGLVGPHSTALVGDPPVLTAFTSLQAEGYQLMFAVQKSAGLEAPWTRIALGSATANADGPSLAMLNGHPGIAFGDPARGDLKIALAESADGQGKWQVVAIDASRGENQEQQQSLALVDGRPAIAYRHATLGLMFAYDSGRRNNEYWPLVVVDPAIGEGFFFPTLAVIAGRPAIVYSDQVGIKFAIAR